MKHSAFRILGAVAFAVLLASDAGPAQAHFLTPAQTDPSVLLPPPPAPDSDTEKAELAEIEKIQAERSAADFARATQDSDTEDATVFESVLGPAFDLTKLPATARLMEDVRLEEKAAAKLAKNYFKRARPYVFDAGLRTCEKPDADPHNSYPSGHATVGFATGIVLASLMPSKAQIILARATDYAHNRLVCGVHFRSDIVAGQVLGTAIAIELLQNKDFRTEYDAAAAELKPLQ